MSYTCGNCGNVHDIRIGGPSGPECPNCHEVVEVFDGENWQSVVFAADTVLDEGATSTGKEKAVETKR